MISIVTKMILYDLLTFGIGTILILTQPEDSWGLLIGKLLMIAGVFVQFRFLKMISCMGGIKA